MTSYNEISLPVFDGIEYAFIICPSTVGREWTTSHNGNRWFEMGINAKQHPQTDESLLANAKPLHRVSISNSFKIMKYPVCRFLWHQVMAPQEMVLDGDAPMTGVSWDDCQKFIRRINEKRDDGCAFSLPTEAQWEYACIGGERRLPFLRVDKPNRWGVCSMCSGCAEWCLDDLRVYPASDPIPAGDPVGPLDSLNAAIRGGDMQKASILDKPFVRRSERKATRNPNCGFRLVCFDKRYE